MEETLNKAIENTLAMIRSNSKSDDALRFSQAALNLAHTAQILGQVKPKATKGAGS